MKRVLLLNPPGRQVYIREYFCSKVSQADYIPPPVDLVMLSGILSRECAVGVLDAIADGLSPEETVRRAAEFNPSAIICLLGSVSFEEDRLFIPQLAAAVPSALLIGIGDLFNERPELYFKEKFPRLDAVLFDFTSDDILAYLRGETGALGAMLVRGKGEMLPRAVNSASAEIGPVAPRHDLFLSHRYRHPFVRSDKFAVVLTEYGCPFKCSFCIMSTLGYRKRSVADVIAELKSAAALGIREVLFVTQTFGANRAYSLELCGRIIAEKIPVRWTCFSRVDVATPELLTAMKQAGCHTVIFGIESGSEKILKKYQKGYTVGQITAALRYCDSIGIETVGTFILGLPQEDSATMNETLQLLRTVPLDYASFNVAVPRAGTSLRAEALADGLIGSDFNVMDQSGSEVAMATKHLTREEVESFRRQAILAFYLRPSYILRRIRKIKSPALFFRHLRQGVSLLLNTWVKK